MSNDPREPSCNTFFTNCNTDQEVYTVSLALAYNRCFLRARDSSKHQCCNTVSDVWRFIQNPRLVHPGFGVFSSTLRMCPLERANLKQCLFAAERREFHVSKVSICVGSLVPTFFWKKITPGKAKQLESYPNKISTLQSHQHVSYVRWESWRRRNKCQANGGRFGI